MALQFSRALRRLATVPLYRSTQASRFATTKADEGLDKPFSYAAGDLFFFCFTEETIATDMEQATGLERKELEALVQGKEVILNNAHLETTRWVLSPAGSVQHVGAVWTAGHSRQADSCAVHVRGAHCGLHL